MTGILSDPLPSGWRRCSSLGCGAPGGHEPPCVPEAVPPVAVAGIEVDVGAEVRGGAAFMAAIDAARAAGTFDGLPDPCLDCGEAVCVCHLPHVLDLQDIADTWAEQWRSLVEADPSTLTAGGRRRRAAMLAIAARVRGEQSARAERIEAAARALLDARATYGDALAEITARRALRAALCTCAAHGPDPACVDHGAAIAAWQRENTP